MPWRPVDSIAGVRSSPGHGGSPSLGVEDYWWYVARADLLEVALSGYAVGSALALDLGSADGPSAGWVADTAERLVSVDVDPRGLGRAGVCASALHLPFADGTFDLVTAFDVIEHCEPESQALSEVARVLRPGGHLLMAVPAYQWAWSDHDVANGHHRRYTRARAKTACQRAGLVVERSTYAFTSVFPLFAAERLARRLLGRRTAAQDIATVPRVPSLVNAALTHVSRLDAVALRRWNLPFGSSVLVATRKPRS